MSKHRRRTLYIGDKRWKLLQQRLRDRRGDCNIETKTIRVCESLVGQELVEVLVHEIVHARVWDLDETAVSDIGQAVASALANWDLLNTEE